jgi:serine/threonine protein kinase
VSNFGFTCYADSNTLLISENGYGTARYRALELLPARTPVYKNKIDIWSMGCILYELATGRKSFRNDCATLYYAKSRTMPDISLDGGFNDQDKESITSYAVIMLLLNPTSRPSSTDNSLTISKLPEVSLK